MATKMILSYFVVALSVLSTTMAASQQELLSATEVSNGNTKFATRLYNILARQSGNVFFSPISAHAVLSLAYQGADGNTAQAFRSALNLPITKTTAEGYKNIMTELNSVQNVTLHIANKVFVKDSYTLKEQFKAAAEKSFLSEAESIDFSKSVAAASRINQWVENKTNKKIKDLIQPDDLDSDTRLVLVNAIYFKGNWLHQFNKAYTRPEKFYLNDVDTVDCQMMHITKNFDYTESRELDAKILRMPYSNKDVSMVIILPNSKTGIQALENKLANKDLSTLTSQMRSTEVIVALPKFKIESTIPLNDPLSELGLEIMFTNAAEFPNLIEGGEPLKVSKVIQKAFIEVNEEGAEAAAATGLIMMVMSMPLPPSEMCIDHPFIVFLESHHADRKQILFQGRVSNPSITTN